MYQLTPLFVCLAGLDTSSVCLADLIPVDAMGRTVQSFLGKILTLRKDLLWKLTGYKRSVECK